MGEIFWYLEKDRSGYDQGKCIWKGVWHREQGWGRWTTGQNQKADKQLVRAGGETK